MPEGFMQARDDCRCHIWTLLSCMAVFQFQILDDEHLSIMTGDRNSLFLQVLHGEGKATV